jgi:hypothetical protein
MYELCMHFSSLRCLLHASPAISSLIWAIFGESREIMKLHITQYLCHNNNINRSYFSTLHNQWFLTKWYNHKYSTSSSAAVMNAWSHNSTPPYVIMALRLIKHRDKFTFYHSVHIASPTHQSIFALEIKCHGLLETYKYFDIFFY